jgi:hypothetical protein
MSPLARLSAADWSQIPPRLHAEIERWIADGIAPVTPFLGDILVGDLRRACSRVPERETLFAIVDFLAVHAPVEAWGNGFNCSKWAELGGQRGIEETDTSKAYALPDDRKRGSFRLWKPGRGEESD